MVVGLRDGKSGSGGATATSVGLLGRVAACSGGAFSGEPGAGRLVAEPERETVGLEAVGLVLERVGLERVGLEPDADVTAPGTTVVEERCGGAVAGSAGSRRIVVLWRSLPKEESVGR